MFISAGSAFEGRPFIRGFVEHNGYNSVLIFVWVVYSAVAINGYVAVGQMVLKSGVCHAL